MSNYKESKSTVQTPPPRPFKKFFDIRIREQLGLPECPYVFRSSITLFGYSIRLHQWIGSDDQRAYHDHPFDFITFVLRGGYTDIHPEGVDKLSRGSMRLRKAEYRHKVKVNKGGCTTLLLTGRPRRKFGFYVKGREKLLRPLRYFSRYGHHPCE